MRERIAEQDVTLGGSAQRVRVRVDLHGVALSGPAGRTAIRWEWVTGMDVSESGVVVRAATAELTVPAGAFGLSAAALAQRLERARASIVERPDVIGELVHGTDD